MSNFIKFILSNVKVSLLQKIGKKLSNVCINEFYKKKKRNKKDVAAEIYIYHGSSDFGNDRTV